MEKPWIVIVDAHLEIGDAACLLFESWGYAVESFLTAEALIESVERFGRTPDCIVTDLVISSFDGRTVFEALRSLAPAPIVVLTGQPHALPEGYPREQVYAVLQKPATPEQLRKTLCQLLDEAGDADVDA